MQLRIRSAALSLAFLAGACANLGKHPSPTSAPHDKVDLKQAALPVESVTEVGGYVGERLEANREGLVKHFDIESYLKLLEDKQYKDWFWVGEHPGKWLESATLLSAEYNDAALEKEARETLGRMVASQEASGYLGVTDPAVRTPEQPLRGMDAYELYFTMHGLMTAYQTLHDPDALEAAKKLGDYFIDTIGPGKAEFWPSDQRPPDNIKKRLRGRSKLAGHSVHYGWEGSMLEDPMLRLYELTGEDRYREWSDWAIINLDRWGGWDTFTRLDDVASDKIGIDELQPLVHSHTFNMCFLGFVRMYRITGDPRWLNKVVGAWEDIMSSRAYPTGGVSVNEHYEKPFHRPLTGEIVETCASMSWMQLNQSLLEISGDPRYADAMERLFLNHIFAAQDIDGEAFRYFTPPNGFQPAGLFRERVDCCQGSGHRLLSMLPSFFYAQEPNALVVNQFVTSQASAELKGGKFAVEVATNYPADEVVYIRVTAAPKGKCALKLRIPAWCKAPMISINTGEPSAAPSDAYAIIEDTWKVGDEIALRLPMELGWTQFDHWEGRDAAPWMLMRGPVVYALDTVWWDEAKSGPAPQDVSKEVTVIRSRTPREMPATPGARGPFYSVAVKLADGREVQATMVPFTNVGQWHRPGEAMPDKQSKAFSYAMGLKAAEENAGGAPAQEVALAAAQP